MGKRSLAVLAIVAAGIRAQTPKLIAAASIQPSAKTLAGSNIDSARGRLIATAITAGELIRLAYGVRDYQVASAPHWVENDRFDIAVKRAGGDSAGIADEKALLRELLADRFQLAIHRDVKEMPVYLLVASNTSGSTRVAFVAVSLPPGANTT